MMFCRRGKIVSAGRMQVHFQPDHLISIFFIEAKPNLKFRQQLNELYDFCMRWYTWKPTTYIEMFLLIVFSFKHDFFDQC